MNTKYKIKLSEEKETLLITLHSKRLNSTKKIFSDSKAQEILDRIDYDFSSLKVPEGTVLTVCLRAKKMDDYVKEFISGHPECMVIHLACGLDTRYHRIKNSTIEWYDLDLPEVIEIRKRFFVETDNYHMISSSVTDGQWLNNIQDKSKPVLILAEGLFMYLCEKEIKSLFIRLRSQFSKFMLIFDAYSSITVKNINKHPSIKKTGASIRWGIDNPKEIEEWVNGLKLIEEWFFNQSEEIKNLSYLYKIIFWISGLFPFVRRAHRILAYQFE